MPESDKPFLVKLFMEEMKPPRGDEIITSMLADWAASHRERFGTSELLDDEITRLRAWRMGRARNTGFPFDDPTKPGVNFTWQDVERMELTERIKGLGLKAGQEVSFSADSAARLDENTILVGGSFRTGVGSLRSGLFLSTDNGKTWEDTGVWMAESATCRLYVLDARHAWAVTCFAIEGKLPPLYTYRTEDGGRTWERSIMPFNAAGFSWIRRLNFRDADHGEAMVATMTGRLSTWETENGGYTWKWVKEERYDPDDPNALKEEQPARRLRFTNGEVVKIEETKDDGKTWVAVGTMPARAEVQGDDVRLAGERN